MIGSTSVALRAGGGVSQADVFISYAREDQERIRPLAEALEAEGWAVFWDIDIPPGETWLTYIGAQLEAARVVIVAWTKDSIKSDFVYSEAARGRARGALVPVLLDGVTPPLGLDAIHAANLVGWRPDRDPLPPVLLKTIRARLGQTGAIAGPPRAPARESDGALRSLRLVMAVTLGTLAVVVTVMGGWYILFHDRRLTPVDPVTQPKPPVATPARPVTPAALDTGECTLGQGIESFPLCVYKFQISSAAEFPAFFERWSTDELKMSYAGAGAFNVGDYPWALKFLEQSKLVGSSTWQSHQPYLIGAYCALNRPDAAAEEVDHLSASLKSDFDKGFGYLRYQGTLSWMIGHTGKVKAALGGKCGPMLDGVVKLLLEYKAKAPP